MGRARDHQFLRLLVPVLVLATVTVSVVWARSAVSWGSGPRGTHAAAVTASSAAAEPPPPAVPVCVTATLGRLTLADRAGEVLMIGVAASAPAGAVTVVRAQHVGGIFLRGRAAMTPAVLARSIATVQAAATDGGRPAVHVAVDQEGGLVQTLTGPGFGRIASAAEQGRWDGALLRRRAQGWAEALRSGGVTMNLAPVADTVAAADAPRNPPIGALHRNYGQTAAAAAAGVRAVVAATEEAGVIATLKHFPGLGRVRENTDASDRAVDPVATTSDPNLQPFAAGADAGAEAVMISSARYPRLDPNHLAAFSRAVITGLLRGKLGFGGLVVSDDLGSAVAVRSVPVGVRAVSFVTAGGDLVLSNRTADAAPLRTALVAAAERSAPFRRRLDEAVTHVLLSKYRHGMLSCPA